jgi:hypothetical protein
MAEREHQQVMGLNADLLTSKALVPKFKYDGGDPEKFSRDFPVVAAAYGVAAVYKWEDEREMTEEEEMKNSAAMLVLREYLTERVLKVVLVNHPKQASTVYRTLRTIYLANDARTKVHVNRDLHMCEMAMDEDLTEFVSRINGLMEESGRLGEVYSPQARMVMVATRLREPWRTMANDKLDREPELDYEKLIQFLVLRERDVDDRGIDRAYAVVNQRNGRGRNEGGAEMRGRQRESETGRERGRVAVNACNNCGQTGHWRRFCPQIQCFRCGRMGHISSDCSLNNTNAARLAVADNLERRSENGQVEQFLYMASVENQKLEEGVFILDGAATSHMVNDEIELNNEVTATVVVQGMGIMNATGKGLLCVEGMELGMALRVPELKVNVISEGILQARGCQILAKDDWRKVFYEEVLVIEARIEKGLFVWRPAGGVAEHCGNDLGIARLTAELGGYEEQISEI